MSKRSFGPIKPAFTTLRLNVFRFDAAPMEQNDVRHIYVATRRDEDRPMVTATAVVWETGRNGGLKIHAPHIGWLDWIEVSTQYRRQGFGRELLEGIEKHLGGTVAASGATEEGTAFCEAVEVGREAI